MVRTLKSLCVIIGLLLASTIVIAVQAQQTDMVSIGKFPVLESETLTTSYLTLR
jgi:hypothetical protein